MAKIIRKNEELKEEANKGFEFIIESKDVVKEYKYDNFKFVVTKNGILFKTTGGFMTFISPICHSLFEYVSMILENIDNLDKLSDEESEILDNLFNILVINLQQPTTMYIDDEYAFEMAINYIKHLEKWQKESNETPLQDEDVEKDIKYEEDMKNIENFSKLLKETENK